MTSYKIEIVGRMPGPGRSSRLEFTSSNFEAFKVEFLKRFGNIRGSNKAEKERSKIKRGIWEAKNMDEFLGVFNHTHWRIVVRSWNET